MMVALLSVVLIAAAPDAPVAKTGASVVQVVEVPDTTTSAGQHFGPGCYLTTVDCLNLANQRRALRERAEGCEQRELELKAQNTQLFSPQFLLVTGFILGAATGAVVTYQLSK